MSDNELERLVDRAASFSVTARSPEARKLAARKRAEARERCNEAIAAVGKLISTLNHADEMSSQPVVWYSYVKGSHEQRRRAQ